MMTARRIAVVAGSAVLMYLMAGCQVATNSTGPQQNGQTGTVTRVIDGDTVDVSISGRAERVRLVGLNAPEISHDGHRADCHGDASAAHARAQLAGHVVTVEADPGQPEMDAYGRRLAYLQLDGRDVGAELIHEGAAVVYTYDRAHPFNRRDAYQRAQDDARTHGRGVWSASTCAGDFDR
ncbi:thermonuclease family protein [Tersicoccus sp. Bi-70]|uniref:thermonuclease family protein n=1 Tax=Tersicoccus sp. Bi-70 TaxID=1897634 RepID=UPI001301289C|nr:thermonuclease family protein [Tersicoccus sp. Bi-70]